MSDNVGGPAFPSICDSVNGVPIFKGMSLRDYFAGAALPLVGTVIGLDGTKPTDGGVIGPKHIAEAAYSIADAMLAERSK